MHPNHQLSNFEIENKKYSRNSPFSDDNNDDHNDHTLLNDESNQNANNNHLLDNHDKHRKFFDNGNSNHHDNHDDYDNGTMSNQMQFKKTTKLPKISPTENDKKPKWRI